MNEKSKLTLYHLTSSDKLNSILKYGLLSFHGKHCSQIGDRSYDIIFLCMEEDIKYWMKCFNDVDVLIEIDCTTIRPFLRRREGRCHAPSGAEYGCIRSIPTECFSNISRIQWEGNTSDVLCETGDIIS